MPFGGYAAQGAQQGLEQVLAAQLAKELELEQQRALQEEREAQRAFRERDFNQRSEEQAWRQSTDARDFNRLTSIDDIAKEDRQRAIKKEEDQDLARRNMGELLDPKYKQSLAEFSMASGVDVPQSVSRILDKKLVPVTTTDAQGRGVQRVVSEDDPEYAKGLPVYEPTPKAAPRQWGYEKVIRKNPDGSTSIVKIRENEQLQPGDVPYEAGRAGGAGSKAEQDAASSKQKIRSAILDIESMAKKINTVKGGIPAFIIGSARDMLAEFGGDSEVRLYNSQVGAALPMVARAIGHVGVLTQQDVDSVRQALPTAADNFEVAKGKMAGIKRRIGELPEEAFTSVAQVALIDPQTGTVEVVPWDQRQQFLDAGARVATREELAASGKGK